MTGGADLTEMVNKVKKEMKDIQATTKKVANLQQRASSEYGKSVIQSVQSVSQSYSCACTVCMSF